MPTMQWKIRARAFAAVLAGCVLAAACRRGDEPAAHDAAEPGRTLRRGLGADPATLDPQLADDNAALTVVADLYEGLATERADGGIVPGAASTWTVDERGLAWIFHLRPDLRWSNGDPLTAQHFAAGLKRALDPAAGSPYAGLLEAIADVDVIDGQTLRVRLSRPLPYLPALLALPAAAPFHPAAAASQPPPSNGAYRLAGRTPGQRIELERNPHWREAAGVAIARVEHVVVSDLATELNLFRTGELDLTSEVPNSRLDALRRTSPGELRLAPYFGVYAYAVNLQRLPDRRARLALAMAVDRVRITGQVTGAGEQPAFGWVPPGIPRYEPARFRWQGLPDERATTEARALWDAARRAGTAPARIRLCTDASANHRRTAVAIADLWRSALGVETEIRELEWQVYLDTRRHPVDCDLVRFGWSADFVDPEAFAVLFESGNPQNTLGYASAAYDERLAASRTRADDATRMALLAEAEAVLLDDVPVIPLFFRVSKRLVAPDLLGVTANPLGHVASRELRFAAE